MFSVTVNWLAVGASAVASMVLGFAWYHPKVFGTAWMAEIGKTEEELQGNPAMYIWTLLGAIITAYVLAVIAGNVGADTLTKGLTLGLTAGIGFIATALASHAIFHGNSFRHYLINAGYYVVNLVVMGLIIGTL